MSEPINKANSLIKEMMLVYPSLYPTRSSAMRGIFCGTNYRWKRDGTLAPVYPMDKAFEGPIDCSDLDESDAQWPKDDDFSRMIRATNELERRTRLFRAENIDLFAGMRGGRVGDGYGYSEIDNWYFDNDSSAVFYTAPFGRIDPDFLNLMEEFVLALLVAYNKVFSLHYDHDEQRAKPEPSMFERMPEKFQRRYRRIKEVEAKLEAQSGTKARRAAFWKEEGPRIMAAIKKEERK